MSQAAVSIASLGLFLALPASAAGAQGGAPVAVQQQSDVPPTPTSDPKRAIGGSAGSPNPVRFVDRPFSMNVMFGAGTIVGGLGAVVEYNLAPRFALGAGMGASWFGEEGQVLGALQGGAFGRFRLALSEGKDRAEAFGPVVGFSTGHLDYPLFAGGDGSWVSEQAYFIQPGMDYELVTRGGFRFAAGAGAAILAGTSNVKDVYSDAAPLDHSTLPRLFLVIDLSVGYAI